MELILAHTLPQRVEAVPAVMARRVRGDGVYSLAAQGDPRTLRAVFDAAAALLGGAP